MLVLQPRDRLVTPVSVSTPAVGLPTAAESELLLRLCRRERTKLFMQQLCAAAAAEIEITAPDGTLLFTTGTPRAPGTPRASVTAPIWSVDTQIAEVVLSGTGPSLDTT